MVTALAVLAVAALVWTCACVGFVIALVVDSRHDKAWEAERPVWADDPTPTYDALVCEQIEKAEGWVK